MNLAAKALAAIAAAVLVGCAHPINITPNATRVSDGMDAAQRIQAKVAYQMPEAELGLEVTTPGGGGDNVRYFPYRDMDAGLELMLTKVFSQVTRTSSPTTPAGADFHVTPMIVTNSGSTGFFTWPPSNFSVDLTCTIRNAAGKIVASPRVIGQGTASTSERVHDYGIAGRRATEDALVKMRDQLRGLDLTKGSPTPASAA